MEEPIATKLSPDLHAYCSTHSHTCIVHMHTYNNNNFSFKMILFETPALNWWIKLHFYDFKDYLQKVGCSCHQENNFF